MSVITELTAPIIAWVTAHLGEVVDWKQIVLVAMIPVFTLSFALEWISARVRNGSWQTGPGEHFDRRETLANIALGYSYPVADGIMNLLVVGAIFEFVWAHRLFTVPITGATLAAIFLVEEFCYYVYHRAAHRIRWFWCQHVSHHSGEVMNMSTAARQSVLNGLVGIWIFFLPPVWLGVHPGIIAAMVGLNLAFQWFVHTEMVPKLHPFFEWLLNTPSNHRVHHGRNPQYIDRNYGGVLMIYDHLFGSYAPEVEKVEYGLPMQIRSYNWLVLNFHEFVDLWRDVFAPGPLLQRLKHLWMPPEWQRAGHQPIHTWTVERAGLALPAMQPPAQPARDHGKTQHTGRPDQHEPA